MNYDTQKLITLKVNEGRGEYKLTDMYFCTCTLKQFKNILKEVEKCFWLNRMNDFYNFIDDALKSYYLFITRFPDGKRGKIEKINKKMEILERAVEEYYD